MQIINKYAAPQDALAALEGAYRNHDIEAAVASKNFYYEGREMILSISKNWDSPPDENTFSLAAKALEASFRNYMSVNGFPDFSEAECSVVKSTEIKPDLVEMIEKCLLPNGSVVENRVHAAYGPNGWGIVILPEK